MSSKFDNAFDWTALTEVPVKLSSAGAGILNIMKFPQLLLICLAGIVVGCGQKGPLVMPDAQKHKRAIPTVPSGSKPAVGGNTNPAPQGSGTATSPAPPSPAPTPPTAPAPADSTPP